MAITVKVTGLAAAHGAIRRLARIAPERLSLAVAESAINIHRNVVRSAPVDTGILRGSYKWEFEPGSNRLTGVVYSDSKYAPYVEFGTRPHWPPIAPLEDWARRHGMPPGSGFLIARAISIRGTRPQPHLFPAAEAERRNFVSAVSRQLIRVATEGAR
jgi:hypothetical protein